MRSVEVYSYISPGIYHRSGAAEKWDDAENRHTHTHTQKEGEKTKKEIYHFLSLYVPTIWGMVCMKHRVSYLGKVPGINNRGARK